MDLGALVTKKLVDVNSSSSASTRWRERRWKALADRFPIEDMSVLDLGGTVESWRLCPVRPRRLTLLNTFDQDAERATTLVEGAEVVVGDACDPPPGLSGFDLVYANSVIEHVGGHYRRQQFAEAVYRLGEHHWVQTPNRWFPVEPHFLCPGLQYLPLPIAAQTLRHWPIGNYASKRSVRSVRDAREVIQDIELVGLTQMYDYFPNSEMLRERVGPLTKSLIATS